MGSEETILVSSWVIAWFPPSTAPLRRCSSQQEESLDLSNKERWFPRAHAVLLALYVTILAWYTTYTKPSKSSVKEFTSMDKFKCCKPPESFEACQCTQCTQCTFT